MAATKSDSLEQQKRQQKWYDPDMTEAPAPIRHLLETYSHIPPGKVVEHINKIRESAWASNPYPCIGSYRFLNLTLATHPLYDEILARIKSSPETRYLDIGCCFGQDLRQLVVDGCPSSQLTGLDLEGPLMELGYDLFLDRETLKSDLLIADVFKDDPIWSQLRNKIDIIHASAFFHLFPWDKQMHSAEIVSRLVKQGGVIVGRQSGSVDPGEMPAVNAGTTSFRHNVQTFRKMWDEIGAKTGTKWRVEGSLDMVGVKTAQKSAVENENSRRLLFSVFREA